MLKTKNYTEIPSAAQNDEMPSLPIFVSINDSFEIKNLSINPNIVEQFEWLKNIDFVKTKEDLQKLDSNISQLKQLRQSFTEMLEANLSNRESALNFPNDFIQFKYKTIIAKAVDHAFVNNLNKNKLLSKADN